MNNHLFGTSEFKLVRRVEEIVTMDFLLAIYVNLLSINLLFCDNQIPLLSLKHIFMTFTKNLRFFVSFSIVQNASHFLKPKTFPVLYLVFVTRACMLNSAPFFTCVCSTIYLTTTCVYVCFMNVVHSTGAI